MSIVETRACDQCSVLYDEKTPSWMILSFPNYTEQQMEFDFCTYQCLQAWVNEEDVENEPESDPAVGVLYPEQAKPVEHAGPFEEPPVHVTLAEALAMGLKPSGPQ